MSRTGQALEMELCHRIIFWFMSPEFNYGGRTYPPRPRYVIANVSDAAGADDLVDYIVATWRPIRTERLMKWLRKSKWFPHSANDQVERVEMVLREVWGLKPPPRLTIVRD